MVPSTMHYIKLYLKKYHKYYKWQTVLSSDLLEQQDLRPNS
jgi:hypothetical protein